MDLGTLSLNSVILCYPHSLKQLNNNEMDLFFVNFSFIRATLTQAKFKIKSIMLYFQAGKSSKLTFRDKAARFLLQWTVFSSLFMRDMTLHSATSFGKCIINI